MLCGHTHVLGYPERTMRVWGTVAVFSVRMPPTLCRKSPMLFGIWRVLKRHFAPPMTSRAISPFTAFLVVSGHMVGQYRNSGQLRVLQ